MARIQIKSGLLNSWKEIASYLDCGVRTAQRWESHGLPVHRITGGIRGSVVADAREVDEWIYVQGLDGLQRLRLSDQQTLRDVLRSSVNEARHQREEMKSLRETRRTALNQLRDTIRKLRDTALDNA
jgi:hypothetical protein